MKKITMLLGLLTVLTIVSCRDKKEIPPPTEPTAAETSTEESNKEADGTSVSIGSDGVDVQTKDGNKETNVKVGDGEANVEIKK